MEALKVETAGAGGIWVAPCVCCDGADMSPGGASAASAADAASRIMMEPAAPRTSIRFLHPGRRHRSPGSLRLGRSRSFSGAAPFLRRPPTLGTEAQISRMTRRCARGVGDFPTDNLALRASRERVSDAACSGVTGAARCSEPALGGLGADRLERRPGALHILAVVPAAQSDRADNLAFERDGKTAAEHHEARRMGDAMQERRIILDEFEPCVVGIENDAAV